MTASAGSGCSDTWTIHLEIFPDPYTGMFLLGVGGETSVSQPGCWIEIRSDEKPTSRALLKELRGSDGAVRTSFGTQLPLDGVGSTVEIWLCSPSHRHRLYQQSLAEVKERSSHGGSLSPTAGGFLRRVGKNLVSGEIFSVWRWRARMARMIAGIERQRSQLRLRLLLRRFRPRSRHDAYVAHSAVTPRLRAAMATTARRFQFQPTISILMPLWNSDPRWLQEAINSVRSQVYERWQLCLADDASTDARHLRFLDQLEKINDPRIRLVRRAVNGHICAASNSAAALATGEFVALLDHDDLLAPQALFEIASLLQEHPDADLIYSDEDKIDSHGHRYDPQFKPDWSPELLLSYNYINHFTCIRRSLFEDVGRFREGFHGSQDHDLLLRITERTDRIYHIPQILYHWRSHPQSTASSAVQKSYVHDSGRKAVAEALSRRGILAELTVPVFAKRHGLPILSLRAVGQGPRVAILIAGDEAAAKKTAEAVQASTDARQVTISVLTGAGPDAREWNRWALNRDEDVLLFLTAGVEPQQPDWLARLLAYQLLPGVGAVGATIRTTTGEIDSAGTVLGLRDGIAPGNAFVGHRCESLSYYFYAEVARNVTAPGPGCLMTLRATFDRLGGFSAERFPQTLFDVDYSLRLARNGQRVVHVGHCEFLIDRPACERMVDPRELRAFQQIYGRSRDRYYNPNFSERNSFEPQCDSPLSVPAEATNPPVRAVVAAHNLNNPEGAPRYLSEIVLGLARRQWIEPIIISPSGGAGEGVYRQGGIPVEVIAGEWSSRFVDGQWAAVEYEACLRQLIRRLSVWKPEVVIANTMLTFPVIEAAARLGIPAIWIIHESYSADALARLFPPFTRQRIEAGFGFAARVIPASHDTAALFANWNCRGNLRVLHNGLDLTPFDDFCQRVSVFEAKHSTTGPTDRKRIISVGTVCERKGQHTLVEAAAILACERQDFFVQIIGLRAGVPYGEYLRGLVQRYQLQPYLELVPETDRIWPYFRAADVFVCTSHIETFSRAILEAEAFALPIVSTPVFGVPEQVFWNFNALEFPFGDAKALARQLRRVLDDEPLRARMAESSRAAIEVHLNAEEMLDRYGAVILSAARTGPRCQRPLPESVGAKSRFGWPWWTRLVSRG